MNSSLSIQSCSIQIQVCGYSTHSRDDNSNVHLVESEEHSVFDDSTTDLPRTADTCMSSMAQHIDNRTAPCKDT